MWRGLERASLHVQEGKGGAGRGGAGIRRLRFLNTISWRINLIMLGYMHVTCNYAAFVIPWRLNVARRRPRVPPPAATSTKKQSPGYNVPEVSNELTLFQLLLLRDERERETSES